MDGADAGRRPVRRSPGVPGGGERARQPALGGHGFNTSVGDAVNIAWKIGAVENGWGGPRLLDSYEPERRDVVEQTVASAAANMRALADVLPRDAATIQAAKRPEFHSLGLVLGYTYAGSPITQPGAAHTTTDTTAYTPAAEPGARLPHQWLPDGSSLYDHLGPAFTLLTPPNAAPPNADPPDTAPTTSLQQRASAAGIPLTVRPAPPGYPCPDYLLVRPDQHIAWRAAEPAGLDIETAAGY